MAKRSVSCVVRPWPPHGIPSVYGSRSSPAAPAQRQDSVPSSSTATGTSSTICRPRRQPGLRGRGAGALRALRRVCPLRRGIRPGDQHRRRRCDVAPCARHQYRIGRARPGVRCWHGGTKLRAPQLPRARYCSFNRRSVRTISMIAWTVSWRAQSRCSSQASETQLIGCPPAWMTRSRPARWASGEVPPMASMTG